jgi:hypothetical protein
MRDGGSLVRLMPRSLLPYWSVDIWSPVVEFQV